MCSASAAPTTAIAPRAVARAGLCIGCGACIGSEDRADIGMQLDGYGQMKPAGDRQWLRQPSGKLAAVCPFSPGARTEDELAARAFPGAPHHDGRIGFYRSAYVGHAREEGYRERGSSGGMVSWVAAELLRRGLVDGVAHVGDGGGREPEGQAERRLFGYRISRGVDELQAGAKSRYFPVELSEVIREIRAVPGRYAIVGIPCFIKAVRLLCLSDPVLDQRIVFTLGLVCGHMKSARMAESFAWQMQVGIDHVARFDYRLKNPDRPANWYTAEVELPDGTRRQQDWWHLADGDWGAGFFQNSACNYCDDVVAETADISFGDAWVEPYSSDGRGTNVVVVRSPLLEKIIAEAMEDGRLELSEVDADFIAGTQAAGFRQRRQGLAYRLTWTNPGLKPRKRVRPAVAGLGPHRRAIYRMRYQLSAWSHRMFWLARLIGRPAVYLWWARQALACYQGLAYSRGRWGFFFDRIGIGSAESKE